MRVKYYKYGVWSNFNFRIINVMFVFYSCGELRFDFI